MVVIKINQWNVRGWGTDTSFKNKTDFIKSQSPPNSLALTIVNELNADATQAHQLFPGSIISATNRGNGIGILNHNNQNIKPSPIFIIEEYIKKAKDLKNLSAKDHNNFKDPKILLTSTIKLRKTTANYYCIPESSLPNIISFDQFI
ncbi:hypothetical protein ACTFIT_011432 [Dictyostelium discoideum]